MNLSLSCRIAEGFLSKREAIMDLAELCHLAVQAPFDSICMRASQLGIAHTVDETEKAANLIHRSGLAVSMVSGDFDIVYNNDDGPRCLQDITPYLDLAERLDTQLIRVCIKHEDDLKAAQKAADEAKERQISLVHQCHVQSLFETVDQIESCLRRIGRPNFGLIYEAANLEQCRRTTEGNPFDAWLHGSRMFICKIKLSVPKGNSLWTPGQTDRSHWIMSA